MTEEEYIKVVCNNIKFYRKKIGLTQFELSCRIGIEDTNLSRIESCKTKPTLSTLFKIAYALEIDIKDLLP